MSVFILPASTSIDDRMAMMVRLVSKLPTDKPWQIEVKLYRKRRSDQQNRYLWTMYQIILDEGGEALGGWTKDDLHEFFLIQHFGSEIIEGFGMKRHKPIKRSAKLSTVEFADFIAHIQQFMAERGVYIPDPNDQWEGYQ